MKLFKLKNEDGSFIGRVFLTGASMIAETWNANEKEHDDWAKRWCDANPGCELAEGTHDEHLAADRVQRTTLEGGIIRLALAIAHTFRRPARR